MANRTKNIFQSLRTQILRFIPERELRVHAANRKGDAYSGKLTLTAKTLAAKSLKDWKTAIEAASDPDNPDYTLYNELKESLKVDLHLMGIIESRVTPVQRKKFKIIDKEGNENEELTELFKKPWFEDFIKFSIESRFEGFTILELFELDENGELSVINTIPQEHTIPKKGLITQNAGDQTGWQYKEGGFAPYYIQVGKNTDLGKYQYIAPAVLAKKLAWGSWLDFIEKFGIPPRFAKTAGDETRQQDLANMLKDMISAHYAVLSANNNEEIIFGDVPTNDAWQVFDKLLERANSEMSKAVLGQTMTTDNGSSRSQSEVHKEVADDRHETDNTFILNLTNNVLIKHLVKISPIYAGLENHTFVWDETYEMSVPEYIEAVSSLSQIFEMDVEELANKTGLPILGYRQQQTPQGIQASIQKKKFDLTASVDAYYKGYHSHTDFGIFAALEDELLKLFNKLVRSVYDLEAANMNIDLFLSTAQHLETALKNVDIREGAIGKKDHAFHNALRTNLYKFGAAKTYAQALELSELLTDENGEVKTFSQFKTDAKAIHTKYNVNWLRTEFDSAKASARMASNWRGFEDDKDLYDLQYDTAGDSKVREEHAQWDGITLPVDDTFWDTHFPPNDWNCRCDVRQVAKGTALTTKSMLKNIEPPLPQFNNNSGKSKLIFLNNHPYIETVGTNTFRELKAVEDYGLQTTEKIYKNGKIPNKDLNALADKAAATKFWDKLKLKDEFVLDGQFSETQLYDVHLKDVTAQKLINSTTKRKHLPSMLDAVGKPHEVYERDGKTYFIKYYESKVIEVEVINKNELLEIQNYSVLDQEKADSKRKGVLQYIQKRR